MLERHLSRLKLVRQEHRNCAMLILGNKHAHAHVYTSISIEEKEVVFVQTRRERNLYVSAHASRPQCLPTAYILNPQRFSNGFEAR
jgi:trehalose-6-phosphate synthase